MREWRYGSLLYSPQQWTDVASRPGRFILTGWAPERLQTLWRIIRNAQIHCVAKMWLFCTLRWAGHIVTAMSHRQLAVSYQYSTAVGYRLTASLPTAQTLKRAVRKSGFIGSVLCLSATAIFHTTSPLTTVKVRPLSPFSYLAEWQTQHKAALQELQLHHGIRPDATNHTVQFPYGHFNTATPRLLLDYALCPRGC